MALLLLKHGSFNVGRSFQRASSTGDCLHVAHTTSSKNSKRLIVRVSATVIAIVIVIVIVIPVIFGYDSSR